MRFSPSICFVSVLASVSLPYASAAGRLGFALGVKKPDGSCKGPADYEADLDAIKKGGSTIVRIYDASECDVTNILLPVAKSKKFQAILGIW